MSETVNFAAVNEMKKIFLSIWLLITIFFIANAQEKADNTFGGWFFTEVNHDFKNGMYVTGYFEHDNYQFKRMECFYFRISTGYNILPWLKFGVTYLPLCEPGNKWLQFGEVDLVGTLKSGNFKVSIRERYRHGFSNGTDELRSRLKVAYSIPESRFGIYIAPEVFTWGLEWKKARHYVAGTFNVTDNIQLETYYMYYAFRNEAAEHVIGFGINFDL